MLLVECGPDHGPERRYAIDVTLGEILGLEYEIASREGLRDVVITSRESLDERRLVVADVLFAENVDLLTEAALPRSPVTTRDLLAYAGPLTAGDLPLLYARPLTGGGHVDVDPDRVELGIDIFGGVFSMLTRLEEVVSNERDAHGRFPAAAALAVRSGFSQRPLADEYVEVLWWALHLLWPGLERRPRTFAAQPTHDVDWPFYSRGKPFETLRQAASDVVVHRNRSLAVDRLRALAAVARSGRAADPCNTFNFLMRTSESHGLRSAFYFMGGGTDPARDAGYPFDDWLRRLIREIDGRGHELGLHPSYRTYLDPEALRRELETFRAVVEAEGVTHDVLGGRQHFLRWQCPTTWRIWAALGLRYDSTLGYAEQCGFRCGTCHEFPVFDLEGRQALPLRERPLIAMEAALLTYQRKSLTAAVDEMRELKAVCRRFGGTFTFLWHNNRLTKPEERAAYAAVLD